jgi:N-acetylated-alpha-linked acidic dipeptidase
VRCLVLLSLLVAAPVVAAQDVPGFARGSIATQLQLEARLRAVPDTASAQRHARTLAARPHVAGTPAQIATADYVVRQMASWGLDTTRAEYEVYLPFNDSSIVELITDRRERLSLDEPRIAADPTTMNEPAFAAMNGYSGAGDVTAPVVYVNYGLPADYAALDSLGVSVAGKVVLARYGRSFRGIKPREAEKRGALAVVLYSDPMDDGFLVGDVYPLGPMRNPDGVQRGSLFNGQGDPSTPGWPSVPGARRVPELEMGVTKLPVIPIGYGNASKIMSRMGGASVPAGWQGGMGFRYHVGNDAVRLRVAVWPERGARAYKRIQNTFGFIRGSEAPSELVIVGAHRDAWSPGAVDNVSGTVSVMEAARAWGQLLSAGVRPKRSLVFATWDAEEWGLVGAVEWSEQMADTLRSAAVAYINLDVTASGRMFSASGTASLHELMRDVSRTVTQPADSVSVYRDWQRRTVTSTRPEPTLGDLGGGSDFMAFYNHLGIPSIAFGFGGPGGSYHSGYDTWTFMERFGDPGYLSHRASAQLAAVLMARLANADVVPFDYGALGDHIVELVARTRNEPGAAAISGALDELGSAGSVLAQIGRRMLVVRNGALADGRPAEQFQASNQLLRQVERQLVDPAGLPGRPILRHQVFASDRDNGYANVQFPAIVEALRDGDTARAEDAARSLAARVRAAASLVEQATAALGAASGR